MIGAGTEKTHSHRSSNWRQAAGTGIRSTAVGCQQRQRRQLSLLPEKGRGKTAQREGPYPKGPAIVLDTAHDGRNKGRKKAKKGDGVAW